MNTGHHVSLYDTQRGWYTYLFDSYWGGDRYRTASSPTLGTVRLTRYVTSTVATGPDEGKEMVTEEVVGTYRTYLVPHSGETREGFERRIQLAAYVNLVQPVVDTYADGVTGNVVRDLGDLAPALLDTDGQGGGWAEHVAEVCRWACVHGVCAGVVDAPAQNPAASAAEERALGVGLRTIIVQPTAWAWVDVDDHGKLQEFAYADQPFRDEGAIDQRVRVYVWTRTEWRIYEHRMSAAATLASQRSAITDPAPVARGALPPGVAGRVPVAFAYHRRDSSSRAPRGASLVGDIADLCRQVYNLLSSAEENLRQTSFAFLAVPTRAAGGQLEPEISLKVGPSAPLPFSSDTAPPSWIEAPTKATTEARVHALFLLAMCLRLAGLEVSADQGQSPESGVALRIRSRGFEARARALAVNMAHYERRALGLAAAYLGRPLEAQVTYPKRFTLPDASEDLDRALLLLRDLGAKLGPEGTLRAIRQATDAALSLSDDELATVVEEARVRLEAAGARTPTPAPIGVAP
jgi:hypothetical protein